MSGKYQPPLGPPPRREDPSSQPEYDPPPGPPPSHNNHLPQPGPPPGYENFQPPPGPPPGHFNAGIQPGAPPGYENFQPPPGPPPSHADPSQPQHDWTVIPDTALLPPPPSLGYAASPTSNAPEESARRATEWCNYYPLFRPRMLSPDEVSKINLGTLQPVVPAEFVGSASIHHKSAWKVKTKPKTQDACLTSDLPLYSALYDSPRNTGQPKTIYYEVEILSLGRPEDTSLAIGFCALPYPSWRLPGWERGSVGIHGDDGHRFVNDWNGGADFTQPFAVGDRVGIGLTFSLPEHPPTYDESHGKSPAPPAQKLSIKGFFTRNGQPDGDWDVHEELDAELEQSVEGLEGDYDLYAGIGVFGAMEVKVHFDAKR
ncbi:MAG: hypothetical protein M1825_000459 [Sarcosagium campestre]|nr:MAG: hypothetical protein M1825_000459 [Sarcosagium campestre]